MYPKVSIIVPVYNVEKYIARCLESLINQTLKEIEIIIVNDNTQDDSMRIIKEYACKDSRIKVFSKENEGLGLTRNFGINKATGEYIGFVDSDDFVSLDFYEKLYNEAKKQNVDMCIGEFVKYFNENKIIKYEIPFENDVLWEPNLTFYSMLDIKNKYNCNFGMSVWKSIYKRNVIERNKINFLSEREILSEDILFNFDYLYNIKTKVCLCKGVYYYYCMNELSLTHTYRKDRLEKAKILKNVLVEKSKKYEEYTFLQPYIESFFMNYVRQAIKQEFFSKQTNLEIKCKIKEILNDNDVKDALIKKNKEQFRKNIIDFFIKMKMINIIYIIYTIKK